MGLLSEFFLAESDYAASRYHAQPEGSADELRSCWKGITSVEAGMLLAVLRGEDPAEAWGEDIRGIDPGGEEEAWLFALPPDFAQLLSAQDPASFTPKAWEQLAGLEEWAAWTEEELGAVAADLVRLSQVGTHRGLSMYLQVSL
ncbi:MAG: hypothetical protein CSA62_07930 [Planctomycetota bacterium]|nr:MAG: hypothetical protein CSA62_07930 [Planctomycetota bacterium]